MNMNVTNHLQTIHTLKLHYITPVHLIYFTTSVSLSMCFFNPVLKDSIVLACLISSRSSLQYFGPAWRMLLWPQWLFPASMLICLGRLAEVLLSLYSTVMFDIEKLCIAPCTSSQSWYILIALIGIIFTATFVKSSSVLNLDSSLKHRFSAFLRIFTEIILCS